MLDASSPVKEPVPDSPLDAFASALGQAQAIRRREVSPRELVNLYLERIDRFNGELNAFRLVTSELALEQAAAAERALREDDASLGPLHGVPVSIKDVVSLAGYPTTLGSRAFEQQVLEFDYFPVARLKAAGCSILGKTTTSEFGVRSTTEHGLHGTARNPWNLAHNAGGSSGGAAAAVAAGLCALSHGNDAGGSTRVPASCCGVVGLRPSRGRISNGPLVADSWAGLLTNCVLARSVADTAAGLDAMAGHLAGDPFWAEPEGSYLESVQPPSRPLRVSCTTAAATEVDREVEECVGSAAATLDELGHEVTEQGPDTSPFRSAVLVVMIANAAALPFADARLLEPLNQEIVKAAKRISGVQYVQAVNLIRAQSRKVIGFWDKVDVLITPTLTRPAPRNGELGADPTTAFDEYSDWLTFAYPYGCTGQPSITLPLGANSQGLPIGVQLVGPPRGEAIILSLAAQLEEALPWRNRRPPQFA
jgi:amidase